MTEKVEEKEREVGSRERKREKKREKETKRRQYLSVCIHRKSHCKIKADLYTTRRPTLILVSRDHFGPLQGAGERQRHTARCPKRVKFKRKKSLKAKQSYRRSPVP